MNKLLKHLIHLLLLLFTSTTLFCATFTVYSLDDSGPGTLRQAILDANDEPGADVINFTVAGTLNLTSPLPIITDDVHIQGETASDKIVILDSFGKNDIALSQNGAMTVFAEDNFWGGAAPIIGGHNGYKGSVDNTPSLNAPTFAIADPCIDPNIVCKGIVTEEYGADCTLSLSELTLLENPCFSESYTVQVIQLTSGHITSGTFPFTLGIDHLGTNEFQVTNSIGNSCWGTLIITPNSIPEVCDGIDNNCDGQIDEGFDVDGDGVTSCGGDCDDNDPNNFPGNTEICDGQDNNCNGQVDEGFDQDSDGIADCFDNCPTTSNSGQADADCDGVGDACDQCMGGDDSVDHDSNGIPDCIEFPTTCAGIHPDWTNTNGNGCSNNGNGNGGNNGNGGGNNGNGNGGNNGNSLNCGFNVYVCKIANGQTQCVNPSAAQSMIDNGNFYGGPCIACGGSQLISPMNPSIGYNEAEANTFVLFPNPAREVLNVDLGMYLEQEISISIFNHLGQQVLHLPKQLLHDHVLTIDLSGKHLPDGIYLLSVKTAEGQQAKQFVIAR